MFKEVFNYIRTGVHPCLVFMCRHKNIILCSALSILWAVGCFQTTGYAQYKQVVYNSRFLALGSFQTSGYAQYKQVLVVSGQNQFAERWTYANLKWILIAQVNLANLTSAYMAFQLDFRGPFIYSKTLSTKYTPAAYSG